VCEQCRNDPSAGYHLGKRQEATSHVVGKVDPAKAKPDPPHTGWALGRGPGRRVKRED
jgi:hypothetical protein